MEIGEILCHLRDLRGLSQDQTAKKLGFSASYLSLLERRKRPATMHVVRRVAALLGVAPGLLLLQSLEMSPLEPRQQRLVRDVRREFEKALRSNDFTALQRIAQE